MVSGVCNTDNFSLLSITIDYGPFGFMEAYNPGMCDLYVNMYVYIHIYLISPKNDYRFILDKLL